MSAQPSTSSRRGTGGGGGKKGRGAANGGGGGGGKSGLLATPVDLHAAAKAGDAELVAKILAGAAAAGGGSAAPASLLNAKHGPEQDTPLIAAVRGGSAEVVRLLLDHKADASAANKAGETAVSLAARLGQGASLRALSLAGAAVPADLASDVLKLMLQDSTRAEARLEAWQRVPGTVALMRRALRAQAAAAKARLAELEARAAEVQRRVEELELEAGGGGGAGGAPGPAARKRARGEAAGQQEEGKQQQPAAAAAAAAKKSPAPKKAAAGAKAEPARRSTRGASR